MQNVRPTVFIGSSSEGKEVAEALQVNLDKVCECVIWDQGLFGLSQGTLESLVNELPKFDFAILVMTPDDLIEVRGQSQQSARDNVLIEIGLGIGVLGRERTYAVYDKDSDIRIPSDLAGITLATYQQHRNGNLDAALGATSTILRREIQRLGTRAAEPKEIHNSAFIAGPMNAFNDAGISDAYADFRSNIIELIAVLKENFGMEQVFSAIEERENCGGWDLPGAALAIDIEKVERHEYFILVCIRDVSSRSVLIEAGMALALGKKCIVFAQNGVVLPFVLRNASAAVNNFKAIRFETMEELRDDITRNGAWIFKF